jgi:hypothetical protein
LKSLSGAANLRRLIESTVREEVDFSTCELTGNGNNCIYVNDFISYALLVFTGNYRSDYIMEDKMGMICSTYRKDKKECNILRRKSEKTWRFRVDGITLEWTFKHVL